MEPEIRPQAPALLGDSAVEPGRPSPGADLNEEGPPGGFAPSASPLVLARQSPPSTPDAEREVLRLAELLSQSQSIARVGGWELDLLGASLYWTEETYRIHELDPAEYRPTLATALAFYAPEYRPIITEAVELAVREGTAFDLELQLLTGSGRRVWVHVSSRVFRAEGRTVKLVGAFQDITELKRIEAARAESEERLRLAMEVTRDGFWDWDLVKGLAYFSPSTVRMLGFEPREHRQGFEFWSDRILPEDRAQVLEAKQRCIDGRSSNFEAEYRVTAQDGSVLWILGRGRVVARDAAGRGLRLVGTHVDITERKLAETENERLQGLLRQAEKMESLGGLARGVAHDMNNVLGAILALATAQMTRLEVGDPLRLSFDTIAKAADRGAVMVKRLLAFSRKQPAVERLLDFNAILLEDANLLERAGLARIRIILDLEPDPIPGFGDPAAVAQALMNLCVNALEAMAEGGVLTLRTRNQEDGWIEVRVEDTGAGMTPEVLDRAVDPFFTTKEVGQGLGLSLVYGTMKAHKGDFEIHSQAGLGTRVCLRFPGRREPKAAAPDPGAGSRAMSVLLVDDDELIQMSLRMTLELLGHRVTLANCGEDGIRALRDGLRPDLVILDLHMPGLGGAATLPILRGLCPETPVLLATGRADQTALDLVANHSGVTLLAKPYSVEDLRKHLPALPPD